MKVALVVNKITEDIDSNLKSISKLIQQVDSCDLVLLPEAAITGLINNDTPNMICYVVSQSQGRLQINSV